MTRLSSLLAALALSASVSALAQISVLIDGKTAVTLRGDQCGSELRLTWTNTSVTACGPLQFWVTTATCGTELNTANGDVQIASFDQNEVNGITGGTGLPSTGTSTFLAQDLPLFKAADAGACGTLQAERTMYVCGSYRQNSVVTTTTSCSERIEVSSVPTLRYDTQPPPVPPAPEARPQDSAVHLVLTPAAGGSGDTAAFAVSYAVAPPAGEEPVFLDVSATIVVSAGTGEVDIRGLENGVSYLFRGRARDAAENQSDWSEVTQATPVKTYGAGDLCRRDGCLEQGGCQSSAGPVMGSVAAVLAMLAFWGAGWRARRRS